MSALQTAGGRFLCAHSAAQDRGVGHRHLARGSAVHTRQNQEQEGLSCFFLSLCLCVHLSVCLPIHLSVNINLSIYPSVRVSIYLSLLSFLCSRFFLRSYFVSSLCLVFFLSSSPFSLSPSLSLPLSCVVPCATDAYLTSLFRAPLIDAYLASRPRVFSLRSNCAPMRTPCWPYSSPTSTRRTPMSSSRTDCTASLQKYALCCVLWCCAVLCCVVLCCGVVLCCVVWCCAVLCCGVLCGVVLCCVLFPLRRRVSSPDMLCSLGFLLRRSTSSFSFSLPLFLLCLPLPPPLPSPLLPSPPPLSLPSPLSLPTGADASSVRVGHGQLVATRSSEEEPHSQLAVTSGRGRVGRRRLRPCRSGDGVRTSAVRHGGHGKRTPKQGNQLRPHGARAHATQFQPVRWEERSEVGSLMYEVCVCV